ncbi:MAG: carboxypeptidase-like regulatory domain-containing protein, partial [Thermoanaerobaculia bacterium]
MSQASAPRFFRFASFLTIILLSTSLFAQTPTGQISGLVVDDSGSALPGVTVTARNAGTGQSRTTVSNMEGQYVLPLLPSGTYEVTAELAGFQTFKRP